MMHKTNTQNTQTSKPSTKVSIKDVLLSYSGSKKIKSQK